MARASRTPARPLATLNRPRPHRRAAPASRTRARPFPSRRPRYSLHPCCPIPPMPPAPRRPALPRSSSSRAARSGWDRDAPSGPSPSCWASARRARAPAGRGRLDAHRRDRARCGPRGHRARRLASARRSPSTAPTRSTPQLGLLKGGGGALLREKIVVAAAERFVVVAETSKRVERLGSDARHPGRGGPLRLARHTPRLLTTSTSADLRPGDDGEPYITDEGHYILDCAPRTDGEMIDLATSSRRARRRRARPLPHRGRHSSCSARPTAASSGSSARAGRPRPRRGRRGPRSPAGRASSRTSRAKFCAAVRKTAARASTRSVAIGVRRRPVRIGGVRRARGPRRDDARRPRARRTSGLARWAPPWSPAHPHARARRRPRARCPPLTRNLDQPLAAAHGCDRCRARRGHRAASAR